MIRTGSYYAYNARHPSTAPRKYYVYTLKDKEE